MRRKAGTATWDSSSGGAQAETRAPDKGPGAKLGRLEAKGLCSTGTVSRSFTSTSMSVSTRTELETVRRDLKPKKGAKGYVRLVTTFGDLNLELHCDICPRTCENFIGLCKRGYYDGVSFHRVIPGFMAQGGDPSGTGRGGESIYGGPFRCEIDSRLCHKGRGVLAMANRGRKKMMKPAAAAAEAVAAEAVAASPRPAAVDGGSGMTSALAQSLGLRSGSGDAAVVVADEALTAITPRTHGLPTSLTYLARTVSRLYMVRPASCLQIAKLVPCLHMASVLLTHCETIFLLRSHETIVSLAY